MTQTGDGDLARKLAKEERLKSDAAADARTTKVRDDLSFASTGTVGSLATKQTQHQGGRGRLLRDSTVGMVHPYPQQVLRSQNVLGTCVHYQE